MQEAEEESAEPRSPRDNTAHLRVKYAEAKPRPKSRKIEFEDLTPEQMEKARSCKTPEEMLALAKEDCYELSDEQLEGISGGFV